MPTSDLNYAIQSALARAECPSTTTDDIATLSRAVKNLVSDKDQLIQERDEAKALVTNLEGRIEALAKIIDEHCDAVERAESKQGEKFELLREAAFRALEHVSTPNPYTDPEKSRVRVIAHLEYALGVSGSQVLEFEIKSDAN